METAWVGLHPSGRAPGPTCGSFDLDSGFEFRSGVECASVVTFVTPRSGGEFGFGGGSWLEFGCDTFGLEFRGGFRLEFSSRFGGGFGAASSASPTFKASLKRKFGAAAEARSKRNLHPDWHLRNLAAVASPAAPQSAAQIRSPAEGACGSGRVLLAA